MIYFSRIAAKRAFDQEILGFPKKRKNGKLSKIESLARFARREIPPGVNFEVPASNDGTDDPDIGFLDNLCQEIHSFMRIASYPNVRWLM
jgi:hypothetical protein